MKRKSGPALPAGVRRVVELLKQGHTLHCGYFGMWTANPIDARCSDVNQHTARSLVARNLIERQTVSEWRLRSTGPGAPSLL